MSIAKPGGGVSPRPMIRPGSTQPQRPTRFMRRPGGEGRITSFIKGTAEALPVIGGGFQRLARRGGGPAAAAGFGFRRRRGRGITSANLRGFNKVLNLLKRVGMVPKKLHLRRRLTK